MSMRLFLKPTLGLVLVAALSGSVLAQAPQSKTEGVVTVGALDFPLMSSSFAGFSDLDCRTIIQTVGANIRATNNIMVNSTLSFGDLNDSQPYLYDTTGSRVWASTSA